MLIGYVSDERYVALADVQLEFEDAAGASWEVRSRASGSVHADLAPGDYRVTLHKPGFGGKRVRLTVAPGRPPHHFRLLSDGLLGYAWPKAVRSGEQSEFRMHSVEPYKLELWRYGWRKSFVRGLGWHDEHGPRAVMQITPDGDYTQTGAAWNRDGYHSRVHSQRVVAPEQSGLYYFHASTASGRRFAFPWVVAPARPTARLAVLACDITWNAYNNFGGRSNYIHADRLPAVPTVNSRLELARYTESVHCTWNYDTYDPLSFDRPEPHNDILLAEKITDPIEGRMACGLAPAEWRLHGWLEREGFAFDLYSETQFDAGVLDLSQYRVLLLGVHPEYWTRRMYERLKRWVFDEGGRLMYLAGNGLNCEVSFPTPDTMVVHNGQIRGLWAKDIGAESRFGLRVESEANLLGVVFDPAGIMTGAPYRVIDAGHWVFAGTGLAAGSLFGEHSLHMRCPGGASGHETDKISPSSPPNVHLLAKGTNEDNGGAEIVLFDTPSGGRVFSTGSICYAASLPVDDLLSRVTANVLHKFLE